MRSDKKNLMDSIIQAVVSTICGVAIGIVVMEPFELWLKLLLIGCSLLLDIITSICLMKWGMKQQSVNPASDLKQQSHSALEMSKNAQVVGTRSNMGKPLATSMAPSSNLQARRDDTDVVRKKKQSKETSHVKKVVLINEEGQNLFEWGVEGKSGLVIGKSVGKEQVEIDLQASAYATMISKQHAVLNFTGEHWCVEDIDSKNGTRVKKQNQNAILDLKLVGPVEVAPGDIIYVANTMLQLR